MRRENHDCLERVQPWPESPKELRRELDAQALADKHLQGVGKKNQ